MSENIAESAERDGGPAFPMPDTWLDEGNGVFLQEHGHPGMSLRDWFAAQALRGLLDAGSLEQRGATELSALSYMVADHMLAERSK